MDGPIGVVITEFDRICSTFQKTLNENTQKLGRFAYVPITNGFRKYPSYFYMFILPPKQRDYQPYSPIKPKTITYQSSRSCVPFLLTSLHRFHCNKRMELLFPEPQGAIKNREYIPRNCTT